MSSDLRNVVNRPKDKGELNLENNLSNNNDVLPSKYGCQILFQDTTLEQAKDPSLPTDAYLVYYKYHLLFVLEELFDLVFAASIVSFSSCFVFNNSLQ